VLDGEVLSFMVLLVSLLTSETFLGIFPEPSQDPIIQIANLVKLENETEPFVKNCFVLRGCVPVIGADIITCNTEQELLTVSFNETCLDLLNRFLSSRLQRWFNFVRHVDPDLITGYNVQNFDLPYIIDRCKTLNVVIRSRII